MSDIFREVDEELRRERLQRLWDRYGTYVIAAAMVIVLSVAGWRGWEYWEAKRAAESGDRFTAALDLSRQGKHQEAAQALDNLAREGTSGYAVLARFRAAGEKAEAGDKAGAAAAYDALANDGSLSPVLRDLAKIKAAYLFVDSESYEDIRRRAEGLAASGSWRHMAKEVLGLSAWRAGDAAAAERWFNELVGDLEAPTNLRARAEAMLTLIAGQGTRAAAATPAPSATPKEATQ
ncbi:MAG: tetratricopeptide repeat protein [Pseudomonadota bacterium]|nr:tetratricopeptide repeat protein [Pseudomonadota bacterium]